MSRPAGAFAGTLHRYGKQHTAFEFSRPNASSTHKHALVWIGGLGDGLLTVDYPVTLSQRLPADWHLIQATTSATLNGWGTTSLAKDATQLSLLIQYLRALHPEGGKLVLMGHSTGCQDAMEYVTGQGADQRHVLDGVILQASVSDREGLSTKPVAEREAVIDAAQQLFREGRREDVLPFAISRPLFGNVPISAYRSLSLLSPNHDGDDDYFSSDLTDGQLRNTFGRFPKTTPLMFLFSGHDEHVISSVDLPAMLARWIRLVREGGGIVDQDNGGIVKGASHNLNDDNDEIVHDLCLRVSRFLNKIADGSHEDSESRL